MSSSASIAYFSMEIALADELPTYSGGLGVLAGDTLRSAADGGLPLVAVSLVHRAGYFKQHLDPSGQQSESPMNWDPAATLTEIRERVAVNLAGRDVQLRAWRYDVQGSRGHAVPVYLLDTDLPENDAADRHITDQLYGGDQRYRLRQEAVLGIGGVRMLRALGHHELKRFHMNEGHPALLVLELAYEEMKRRGLSTVTREVAQAVKPQCVFTTHTPVPAGHDQFPLDLVREEVSGYPGVFNERAAEFCLDNLLNMTYLALDNSEYINGVARRHGEVSRQIFTQYKIDSITNGVHAGFWTAPTMQALFDRHITAWRDDNASLRAAIGIPSDEAWAAHQQCKEALLRTVAERTGIHLFQNVFTLGFARRATPYKRADLLFHDVGRLLALHRTAGPIQIVYAGKAHPRDGGGKELIRRIFEHIGALKHDVTIAYLEDYDMALARQMVSGVDLWLNTPEPPLEASGTSGMKAALNGVPQLSILDGWWIEGCIEGVTGWAIGTDSAQGGSPSDTRAADAQSLYNKLETVILPLFYRQQARYIDVMKSAIALNGSYFNTERMVDQYVRKAYYR